MAFSHKLVPLNVSPKMRLRDAAMEALRINFGGTDVSLPIQALDRYRQKTGIPAKLAVIAMAGNDFTVAVAPSQ